MVFDEISGAGFESSEAHGDYEGVFVFKDFFVPTVVFDTCVDEIWGGGVGVNLGRAWGKGAVSFFCQKFFENFIFFYSSSSK